MARSVPGPFLPETEETAVQTRLRDRIGRERPFSAEEYAARRRRPREAMAKAGLDALHVTAPADPTRLTG